MAGRALVLFLVAAWMPSAAVLVGCGSEGERADRAPAAQLTSRAADPFSGSYRVRGLTTDVTRGDTRRIEGIIVLTEKELAYRLTRVTGKKAYAPDATCPNMKKIGLYDVHRSVLELEPTVEIVEELMAMARIPIERMLAVGRGEEG